MQEKECITDSVCLLKECDSGCKMATDCMEQIEPYVKDEKLMKLLKKYNAEHIRLGEECHKLLHEAGEPDKDPHPVAKMFSWLTSEVKLQINSDEKQIASILTDGCNMGIKSLNEKKNKYKSAKPEAVDLCNRLLKAEERMVDDMACYL